MVSTGSLLQPSAARCIARPLAAASVGMNRVKSVLGMSAYCKPRKGGLAVTCLF